MTDAQSFYLLLLVFYLIECLELVPNGSRAFLSRGTTARKWRPRSTVIPVNGLGKDLVIGAFLPWPALLAVPGTRDPDSPLSPRALRHLRKRARFLNDATAPLRSLGLLIFLHFFLLLPLVYYFLARSPLMIGAAVFGYALCLIAAVRFYRLHSRFFPKDAGDRWKLSLFTAFLPWHAMRAAEHLVTRKTTHWQSLVLLASDPDAPHNRRLLRRAWNESRYLENPPVDRSTVTSIFEQAGLDIDRYVAPPPVPAKLNYCPVCESSYAPAISQCANCEGVELFKADQG